MFVALGWPFVIADGGTPAQPGLIAFVTTDVNFPPSNVVAQAALTGLLFGDNGALGSIGFLQYEVVDPNTGVVTTEDLSTNFFGTTAMFTADNVVSVTVVASALASPGPNETFVQGIFRIDAS
jgi:hypothetical protein